MLQLLSLGPDLAESGVNDNAAFYAFFHAMAHESGHTDRRHGEDGQINMVRDFTYVRLGLNPQNFVHIRVYRKDPAPIAGPERPVERIITSPGLVIVCPDKGHRFGFKY